MEQLENIDFLRARYRTAGGNWQLLINPTNIPGSDTSRYISGLSPNTSYEIQMKSWCIDGTNSSWSNTYSFSTEQISGCTDPNYC